MLLTRTIGSFIVENNGTRDDRAQDFQLDGKKVRGRTSPEGVVFIGALTTCVRVTAHDCRNLHSTPPIPFGRYYSLHRSIFYLSFRRGAPRVDDGRQR